MSRSELDALTRAHMRQQLGLRAATIRDLVRLYPMWDPFDRASYERFIDTVVLLAQQRAVNSSALAARYYQMYKEVDTGLTWGKAAQLAEPPTRAQIDATVRATAVAGFWRGIGAGQVTEQALKSGLVQLSGGVTRQVLNGGRETLIGTIYQDQHYNGWIRVSDGDPCAFCAMLLSRGPVYLSEASGGGFNKWHDHCVPAGTLVNGPSTELGYRRWYEGEMVIISTATGEQLAITPNHPVLTRTGWVKAGEIKEGDEIAKRTPAKRNLLFVPDEQEVPSRIEDVWSALSVDGFVSVPVAAEDFHGDGTTRNGNVHIVATDGFLSDERDIGLREHGAQVVGSSAWPPTILGQLPGCGDAALVPVGVASTSSGGVGSLNTGGPDGWLEMSLVEDAGLLSSPKFDTGGTEPTGNGGARDPVEAGEGCHRDPAQIGVDDPFGRGYSAGGRVGIGRTRFDPPTHEGDSEALGLYAKLGCDLLKRLSGGVEFHRVSEFLRVPFNGHVYNLQTVEGWYAANNYIISNCGCSIRPFAQGDSWPAANAKYHDLWQQTKNDKESTPLNAFRRALEGTTGPVRTRDAAAGTRSTRGTVGGKNSLQALIDSPPGNPALEEFLRGVAAGRASK